MKHFIAKPQNWIYLNFLFNPNLMDFCTFFGLKAAVQIKIKCNWLNTECDRQKHKNFIGGIV